GDNAAALAEFGANGTDQRGAGFPRFNGTVDIGAVETGGANITVAGKNHTIVNGDSSPTSIDGTDFGTAKQGSNPLDRTFTVTNTGSGTLTLTTPDLPSGYTIIEPLNTSIPIGGSDSFTI